MTTSHNITRMRRLQVYSSPGLHDLAWQQTSGVTRRTSRRPRARMPELGMLLWRSPLGTMGLCIKINLHAQQDNEWHSADFQFE